MTSMLPRRTATDQDLITRALVAPGVVAADVVASGAVPPVDVRTTRAPMDRVVIDPDTAVAWVGAGVTECALAASMAEHGLVGPGSVGMGPVGPGSVGMVAGVLRCTLVTPDGTVHDVGPESALFGTALFGTAGTVTEREVALRLA